MTQMRDPVRLQPVSKRTLSPTAFGDGDGPPGYDSLVTGSDPAATPVDGRRARGERTRIKVLEALLALVDEGDLHPTAQAVAGRAGVALRTVYHHFEDVEALRRMALDLQLDRHREILRPIDPKLSLDERITQFARQCRRLFEALTPIRRATLFDENSSSEMADGLRRARFLRREHLEATFAPELQRAEGGRELVDAADVASSWQTWYYLRQGLGRSANVTETTIVALLTQLISDRGRKRRS